jgi:uncharacterized protein (TIGR00255 family)
MTSKTTSGKIHSMTGIGTARGSAGSVEYLIDIRSVNNRYLDLSVRLPNHISDLELPIKTLGGKYLKRGKVNVSVSIVNQASEKGQLQLNEKRLVNYHKQLTTVAKRMKVEPLRFNDLLRLPQVFDQTPMNGSSAAVRTAIKKTAARAFEALVHSRQKEGVNLKKDIKTRLTLLKSLLKEIISKRSYELTNVHKKLVDRLKKFSDKAGADGDRIAREAAYIIEKADISEEVVRFQSHLELFEKTLVQGEEIGKKLDFILQELNREANTVASKASSFKIAKQVISMKSEIEKIREQVQNIE